MAVEFGSPPKRAGRIWESLTGAEGSGGLSGGTGRFERPSWGTRRGQKDLPESREGLRGSGEVGSPSQRAGMGQKAQQVGWEGSGGPLGEPGGVGSPLERCGKSWQALLEGREGSEGPTRGWVGSGGPAQGR